MVVEIGERTRVEHRGVILNLPRRAPVDVCAALAPPSQATAPTQSHSFTGSHLDNASRVFQHDINNELDLRGVGYLKRRRASRPDPRLVELMIAVAGVTEPGQEVRLDSRLRRELNMVIHSVLPRVLASVGLRPDAPVYRYSYWGCTEDEQQDNALDFLRALGCTVILVTS